jgi:hypothetical protein
MPVLEIDVAATGASYALVAARALGLAGAGGGCGRDAVSTGGGACLPVWMRCDRAVAIRAEIKRLPEKLAAPDALQVAVGQLPLAALRPDKGRV